MISESNVNDLTMPERITTTDGRTYPMRGLRAGANSDLRVDHEWVIVLTKETP